MKYIFLLISIFSCFNYKLFAAEKTYKIEGIAGAKITGSKKTPLKLKVLIKWEGYSNGHNTWEDADRLSEDLHDFGGAFALERIPGYDDAMEELENKATESKIAYAKYCSFKIGFPNSISYAELLDHGLIEAEDVDAEEEGQKSTKKSSRVGKGYQVSNIPEVSSKKRKRK